MPVLRGLPRQVRPAGAWIRRGALALGAFTLLTAFLTACDASPKPTPAMTPGAPDRPRAVIIVTKDYTYLPAIVDLVPGESVILQIVNGGLAVHEVVIGTMNVQDAWEAAEAATIGAPPGPTPLASVAPDVAGLRVVVQSGQRMDVPWTVPTDAASRAGWWVGCHIPGHWAEGMVVPIRFIGSDGRPRPTEAGSKFP